MGLDRNYLEPEFLDVVPFSPFIASLTDNDDRASGLVIELYIYEQMLIAYEEADLLLTIEEITAEICKTVGDGGWATLHTLYERQCDEFWEALHSLLSARPRPIGPSSLDGLELI